MTNPPLYIQDTSVPVNLMIGGAAFNVDHAYPKVGQQRLRHWKWSMEWIAPRYPQTGWMIRVLSAGTAYYGFHTGAIHLT